MDEEDVIYTSKQDNQPNRLIEKDICGYQKWRVGGGEIE